MRVDELLKLADSVWHNRLDDDSDSAQLATAISDLLTAETCGWERPVVNVDSLRRIGVPDSWAADVSPADARVMAVMLLVTADSADGKDEQ